MAVGAYAHQVIVELFWRISMQSFKIAVFTTSEVNGSYIPSEPGAGSDILRYVMPMNQGLEPL